MTQTATPRRRIPAVGYLALDDSGPHLVAQECASCGALYFDRRNACANCSAQVFGEKKLATTGRVVSYTVVHRAAPGLRAPYASVVVLLDGGGYVKANMQDTTNPEDLGKGPRVRLVTFAADEDDDGVTAVAFGFETIGESA